MRDGIPLEAFLPKNSHSVHISWIITMKCNYDCWYCDSHGTFSNDYLYPIDKYIEAINYLTTLWDESESKRLQITGGEPTLLKDWDRLLEITSVDVEFLTNLSLPLKNLQQKLSRFKNKKCITVSYHPEFSDIDLIIEKILFLKENGNLSNLKLINDSKQVDKVNEAYNKFIKLGIPLSFTYLNNQISSGKLIASNINIENQHLSTDKSLVQLKSSDKTETVSVPTVYEKKLNKFKGMFCELGQKYLWIHYNGDVYPSACTLNYPQIRLGNVYKKNVQLFTESKRCPYDLCTCGWDLKIPKYSKKSYNSSATFK